MKKIALVTGATAGIGEAIAIKYAHNGMDVIVSGRRMERLSRLAKTLSEKSGSHVLPLQMDVSDRGDVEEAVRYLPDDWKNIDILVNNAGLAVGLDKLQDGNVEDWERMIDTNVKGLLYVTRTVLPLMLERNTGHVINIGSMAGREVYPKGNVYCATKHAVDALTKAMRIDLLGKNIKVTQIAPGLVETEFSQVRFKGDSELAKKVYEGYQPLKAEDIADIAFYLTTLPPHVCINDLAVTPMDQANSYLVNKREK